MPVDGAVELECYMFEYGTKPNFGPNQWLELMSGAEVRPIIIDPMNHWLLVEGAIEADGTVTDPVVCPTCGWTGDVFLRDWMIGAQDAVA